MPGPPVVSSGTEASAPGAEASASGAAASESPGAEASGSLGTDASGSPGIEASGPLGTDASRSSDVSPGVEASGPSDVSVGADASGSSDVSIGAAASGSDVSPGAELVSTPLVDATLLVSPGAELVSPEVSGSIMGGTSQRKPDHPPTHAHKGTLATKLQVPPFKQGLGSQRLRSVVSPPPPAPPSPASPTPPSRSDESQVVALVSLVSIHVVESSPVVKPPPLVSPVTGSVLVSSMDVSVVSDVGKSVVRPSVDGSPVLTVSVEPVGSSVMVRMPEVSDVALESLDESLERELELDSSVVVSTGVVKSKPPSGETSEVLLSEHPKSPADVNRAPIQTSLASNVLMFPFPERAAAPIDART